MGGRSGCGLVDGMVHEHRLDPRRHCRRRVGVLADRLVPCALDRVGAAVRPAGLPLLLAARPAGVASSGRPAAPAAADHRSVRLTVLFSYVNNDLFTALQQLDPPGFVRALVIFCVLATVWVVNSLLAYLRPAAGSRSAAGAWLTDRIVGDWLPAPPTTAAASPGRPIDNPDQRIQEDINTFTVSSATLAVGAVSSMVSLVSFTVMLWQLSGPLTVLGVEIPRAMTFFAYLYVIIATVIAFRIGQPAHPAELPATSGSTRPSATRSSGCATTPRTSPSTAASRSSGAPARHAFGAVIDNAWAIVFRSLKFQRLQPRRHPDSPWSCRTSSRRRASSPADHPRRRPADRHRLRPGAATRCRSSGTPTTTSPTYRAVLIRLTGLLDADAEARALPRPDVEPGRRPRRPRPRPSGCPTASC